MCGGGGFLGALSILSKVVGLGSSLGLVGKQSKSSKTAAVATSALEAETAEDKRKKAIQKKQRTPTETFLTGGQGLAQGGDTFG